MPSCARPSDGSMNWKDAALNLLESLYRVALLVGVFFVIIVGLYSCAEDVALCADYHGRAFIPDECSRTY